MANTSQAASTNVMFSVIVEDCDSCENNKNDKADDKGDTNGVGETGIDDSDIDENDIDKDCNKDGKDYHTVTLRRSRGTNGNLLRVSDDDYKFLNMVEEPFCPKASRRKIEIGSETMVSETDLKLAATLIKDAMEGRTQDIKTEDKYVRSYNLYNSRCLTYLLYLTIILNQVLVLFERPAVKDMELPYWVTMLIEVVCLVYFVVRTLHQKHWRRNIIFFRDLKNLFLIFLLTATVLDMLIFLIFEAVGTPAGMHNIRYSRALRPLFIVNFSDGRQIRRAWRNIRRTIKEIIHVLILFYFFIFVFSLIAYMMFKRRYDIVFPGGDPYFKNYLDCVWNLYVLITTSNNPDVMMPAYDSNKFYSLFFFVYILVCFYLLLNVLLAVAYHSYNSNMKNEIKKSSRDKRKKLKQAFDRVKININGNETVTYSIWKKLMNLAKPELSKNQIDLLMLILDMNRSGCIGRQEFMNVADLLNVPVSEVADRLTCIESLFPGLYNSAPSEFLKAVVESIYFKFMFDSIVVIQVFLLAFFVEEVEYVFSVLFLLEIMLKIYTFGARKYLRKVINWLDMIVTVFSFIILCMDDSIKDPIVRAHLEAFKVVRVFRVLRLLAHVQRFRIIGYTLINISQSILMYGGIVFVSVFGIFQYSVYVYENCFQVHYFSKIIFYMFAVIGMEVFQGRVHYYGYGNITNTSELYCGAEELKGSAFYESRYCNLNFNDFTGAIMVLATLLFENNWHIIADGYALVTNKAARIYFSVFFLTAVIVTMNIVTAFVVDMFMYEYTIQKEGKVDSPVEKKIKELGLGIDAETGVDISGPLTNEQMKELVRDGTIINQPEPHPWIEVSTLARRRKANTRFSRLSQITTKRRPSAPTLSSFDGIRFHIKRTGWTKIEVLLQQLYESESANDTNDSDDEQARNETKKTRSLVV